MSTNHRRRKCKQKRTIHGGTVWYSEVSNILAFSKPLFHFVHDSYILTGRGSTLVSVGDGLGAFHFTVMWVRWWPNCIQFTCNKPKAIKATLKKDGEWCVQQWGWCLYELRSHGWHQHKHRWVQLLISWDEQTKVNLCFLFCNKISRDINFNCQLLRLQFLFCLFVWCFSFFH